MSTRIGVVGLGVVGETIYKVMRVFHDDVKGYDVDIKKTHDTQEETLKARVLFVSLPTPLNDKGRLDATLITDFLSILDKRKFDGLTVVKSTLPLNFLKEARKHDIRVLYSPEFLHQRAALIEMMDPAYVVVSGSKKDFLEYTHVLYWIPAERFHFVNDRVAEMIKLAMNAFAATKISFVNEIERVCRMHGADVEKVMEVLRLDKRCGSEYSFPNRGAYGGACLEKDIKELKNSTANTFLLEAVEKVNERTKAYYNLRHR
jgi:UDPglucose 6-dehydrogenase